MDVFRLAAQMLGDMALSSDQLAQFRAINTRHYLQVDRFLQRPDGRRDDRDLTEAETAELHAMLRADILEVLTPEQRSTLELRSS